MRYARAMMAMALAAAMAGGTVLAQTAGQKPPAVQNGKPALPPPPTIEEFVLGPADVLTINVLLQPDLSGDFVVRPDGKISMVQIGEVMAAGLKPEDLRTKVKTELKRIFEEPVPEVFVIVKVMNSRMVYVDGAVNKRGPIPIFGEMRISQAIALAGGLQEFANRKKILVISGTQKKSNGEPMTWFVNYEDISNAKNLLKNDILLNPGDRIIVNGG